MTTTPTDSQEQAPLYRGLALGAWNLLVLIWHTGAKTREKILYEIIRAEERSAMSIDSNSGRRVIRPSRRLKPEERANLEQELSANLDSLLATGHMKKFNPGNVFEISSKGRKLISLDHQGIPPRELGVLSSDADWENLILKVLALKVNEESYGLEDLVRDLRLLDSRFGYRVRVESDAYFERFVGRTVRWLAGEWDEDIGRPKAICKPEVVISRRGDREHISLCY